MERLLAEPLSLAVIDQITNEGWVEGWHVEEGEVEEGVEQGKENGIGKVEQGNKETGGKKEELGRIPLSVPRYLISGSSKKILSEKMSWNQTRNAPSKILQTPQKTLNKTFL